MLLQERFFFLTNYAGHGRPNDRVAYKYIHEGLTEYGIFRLTHLRYLEITQLKNANEKVSKSC